MLSSRLTSTLISSSTLFVLSSCSLLGPNSAVDHKKHKKQKKKILTDIKRCQINHKSLTEKHLLMSVRGQSKALVNCFKNYMRFEKNKNQSVFSCNRLAISRSGRVKRVDVFKFNHTLPKDYEMCIKQEFWKMSFKGLQLSRSYEVVFPISFTSKK